MKVHLHHFSKIKSPKEVKKQYESRFFLLFCLMIYQDPDRYLAYPACSRGTVKNSSFCAISINIAKKPQIHVNVQHMRCLLMCTHARAMQRDNITYSLYRGLRLMLIIVVVTHFFTCKWICISAYLKNRHSVLTGTLFNKVLDVSHKALTLLWGTRCTYNAVLRILGRIRVFLGLWIRSLLRILL